MSDSRERFMHLLKNEILQLDQPDLDFGIYRILNFRRAEIERFFDDELPVILEKAVAGAAAASTEAVEEDGPFAQSELDRLYNYLYVFFSRYYRDGDFEPQPRRARDARYSVPYNGEDVHFYWRSFGSHYVKSAEELRSYRFKSGKQVVRFELVDAYEEADNMKGATRYFMPISDDCEMRSEPGGGVFIVPFAFHHITAAEEKKYRGKSEELGGNSIQERLVSALAEKIALPAGVSKTDFAKHLRRYTARARRDYFVHPRLASFLEGELDYFLKNEVLDVSGMTSPEVVADRLGKLQVLRDVAGPIIKLLDDLEATQAQLFEKARFVFATDYLIRLDMIPHELWSALLEQPALLRSWQEMLGEGRTMDMAFLESMPTLVVDTSLVSTAIHHALVEALPDLDAALDGVLVAGDNYGALRTLAPGLRGRVDLVYNDPPYNTGSDGFPYKDDFARHSTWLSMLGERTNLCRLLLAQDGVLLQSIDENEHVRSSMLLDVLFGERNRVADIVWKNSSKNDQDYISVQHEYIIGAVKDKASNSGEWTELKEGLDDIYKAFEGFHRDLGSDWDAIHERALEFYRTLPPGHPARDHKHYNWMDDRGVYFASDISGPNFGQYRYDVIHPITGQVCKEPASGWRFPQDTMVERIASNLVHFGPNHTTIPKNKTYLSDTETQSLTSVKYRDGRVGSKALENILGSKAFDNPKDPGLLAQLFGAIAPAEAIILDAFAGSGSTGQAVIELNRKEGTRRRFVLVELDRHFDTVLVQRIARLMLSPQWVAGVPQLEAATPSLLEEGEGEVRLIKILRLERFDDSLNSLQGIELPEAEMQLNVDRPLGYLSDLTTTSRVALNTADLEHPFEYSLNVHREDGLHSIVVDIPETFRLLAGIQVERVRWLNDGSRMYLLMSGTQGGERVLVVWRDVEGLDAGGELKFLRDRLVDVIGSRLDEFGRVWHNADSAIPSGQSLDAEFRRLMFEPDSVLT